jgi:hypothetical protein
MKNPIAQKLYETYCAAVGGKAPNGDPLPPWEELASDEFASDEKKRLQSGAWLALEQQVENQIDAALKAFRAMEAMELTKLSLAPGDIVLVTVPKEAPLTPQLQTSLAGTFTNLLHDKGVRVLIKNADIALEVLADLLTADDLAKMARRMEQKKLAAETPPEQKKNPGFESN